jgi:hypothetical protein
LVTNFVLVVSHGIMHNSSGSLQVDELQLISYIVLLQATFSIQSDERPDIGFRTYTSLQEAANEASVSRLYAGLHFPSANIDGQLLGKLVGEYVFDNFAKSGAAKVPASAATFQQAFGETAAQKVDGTGGSKPATGRRLKGAASA